MTLIYIMTTVVALFYVVAGVIAAVAFNQLGWGHVARNLCAGLILAAFSWLDFALIGVLTIPDVITIVIIGLLIKLSGLSLMCLGFWNLYLAAKGKW